MRKSILFVALFVFGVFVVSGCGLIGGADRELNPAAGDVNPLAAAYMPDFSTTTLTGEAVDCTIFYEAELTMVNIWGSFCGPCIEEMPDLERLSKDLKKQGIRVIGILVDDDLESAGAILADAQVTFTNLTMDASLQTFLGKFQYVPTTIFIDGKGQVMPEIAVGARGYEEYKALAESALRSATAVPVDTSGGG
jgi:thiol-disulfide isomerase/thioredoxin